MWARARDAQPSGDRGWLRWLPESPTDLIEFDYLDRSRIVEVTPGVPICRLRATGAIGSLHNGECRTRNRLPQGGDINGEIRNANSGYCLDGSNSQQIDQRLCNGQSSQQWIFSFENAPIPSGSILETKRISGKLKLSGTNKCMSIDHAEAVLAECSETTNVEFHRIGNTFQLRNHPGQCLHVIERSLVPGAQAVPSDCPPPGRADFHWEYDAMRDATENDLLFSVRSLVNSVRWLSQPDDEFTNAVANTSGQTICRHNGRLGFIEDSLCRLTNEVDVLEQYESLFSNAAINL